MDQLKSKKPVRNVLGRGLSSLISSAPVPLAGIRASLATNTDSPQLARKIEDQLLPEIKNANGESVLFVEIEKIVSNPVQPRQHFSQAELKELSDSILALGVLQPVLLRRSGESSEIYEIVAGERRWRASKIAGLTKIPAIIKDIGDLESLEIALVENVQRQDLNPIEEAQAYQRLSDEFGLTQGEISQKVGKDKSTIANFVRLLKLPEPVREMLRNTEISVGHAKAILSIREPSAQISLARKAVKEGLSVRALENIVSSVVVLDAGKRLSTPELQERVKAGESEAFPELSERLRRTLGTKVVIRHLRSGRGKIEIEYFSEQELDRIVEAITA